MRAIPLAENDVTVIKDKGLIVISEKKFEELLRYVEDLQDQLAFTKFDLQEEKEKSTALSALSEKVRQELSGAQTIPERVRAIVDAKKLSLYRLAKAADLPYTTVQRIVHGGTQDVKAETLARIARALKVPETILIRGVEEKREHKEGSARWGNKTTRHREVSL